MSSDYNWRFSTVGNVTRVSIDRGADIEHIAELDQKLWTVLSCPVKGLEFDEKTLNIMDLDGDGKIRVKEVIAASQWICKIIKNPELLLKQESYLPLSAFNLNNEDGKRLHDSAIQILNNLGLKKDNISISDTSDSMAIFAKTRFNGDGVITEQTAEDEIIKNTIIACVNTIGSVIDRSGDPGINAELVEQFYSELSDFADWKESGEQNKQNIFPYSENTAAALEACLELKSKISDYFIRCKLIAFDSDSSSALDVSVSRIEAISANDLSGCIDDIASYPLARVDANITLPLSGINPAWQDKFDILKKLIFDVDYPGQNEISELQWNQVLSKFEAYSAWVASKKGTKVESLGIETIKQLIEQNNKSVLLDLIAEDRKLETEAGAINEVDKLLHIYRDLYRLIKNFVTFQDFYSRKRDKKAIFQAGTLYIDQRSCDLCFKVSDMSKHNAMVGQSGMFIIYCNCTSKVKNQTMTIAAVLTDGDINNITVGKNAVFYDNDGLDWDATITKVIDNPISIRQGFWQPYKKFGKFVEDQINKVSSTQDNKMMKDATGKVSDISTKVSTSDVTTTPTASVNSVDAKKAQAFDIAKFCGIFAAIGMALGYIGSFLTACISGFVSLDWWQMILVIPGIMLIISGPSMIMAWMKLKRRNISPILNANGWAINSQMMINLTFGGTLTHVADIPKIDLSMISDPFADKQMSKGKKMFILTAVLVVVLFAILFFTNSLKCIGLPLHKEKAETEITMEPTVVEPDTVNVEVTIP